MRSREIPDASQDVSITTIKGLGITEGDLIEELAALVPKERKPGGITVTELSALWNCSDHKSRKFLLAKEQAGEYYSEEFLDEGHFKRVWYKKVP